MQQQQQQRQTKIKFSTTSKDTKTIHFVSFDCVARSDFLQSIVLLYHPTPADPAIELPEIVETETFSIFIKFLELWPEPPSKSLISSKTDLLSARPNFTKREKSFLNFVNKKNQLLKLCLLADYLICDRLINVCHRALAFEIRRSPVKQNQNASTTKSNVSQRCLSSTL